MKDLPTIRALAKMAGVSNATVSLALRNHPRIRPEVRERIQQIAAEAGYKPNPLVANLLSQLRVSKSHSYQSTLGLFSIWENPARIKPNHTFGEYIAGCRKHAGLLGYGLDLFSLVEPEITPERLVKILQARNIRGLLVIGSDLGRFIRPELDPIWNYSAAIVLGVRPIHPLLSFTLNDHFSTTMQAMGEVLQLGYERPALCLEQFIDDSVGKRFSGGFLNFAVPGGGGFNDYTHL